MNRKTPLYSIGITLLTVVGTGVIGCAPQNEPLPPGDPEEPLPGLINALCNQPADMIYDIQGTGTVSPRNGQSVEIEGVVVGDFQGSSALGGFFVQEEDADADDDAATSDGIFVKSDNAVSVGDLVRVKGTVKESFSLTTPL